MNKLHIFRVGRHTATSGESNDFTEDKLAATAAAYDPAKHEAPLTVGHPKDNLPAYGWVSALHFADGNLEADPHQVNPDFAELVNSGAFKKISASFYTPDSPSNPVPGGYYLRHVAFLGAQPPAVKGMRDASFNDADDATVVTFEESIEHGESWMYRLMARLFRGQREHMIDKESLAVADQVMPAYLIEDLEAAATAAETATVNPNFSETEADQAMSKELDDRKTALDTRESEIKAREDAAAAKETEFAERAKVAADKANAEFADAMIAANKIVPAERGVVIATLGALANASEVSFGEGDKAVKMAAVDAYKKSITDRKAAVDFGERAGSDGNDGGDAVDANDLADRAKDYQEAQRAKGRTVSATQAVAAVRAGKAA